MGVCLEYDMRKIGEAWEKKPELYFTECLLKRTNPRQFHKFARDVLAPNAKSNPKSISKYQHTLPKNKTKQNKVKTEQTTTTKTKTAVSSITDCRFLFSCVSISCTAQNRSSPGTCQSWVLKGHYYL